MENKIDFWPEPGQEIANVIEPQTISKTRLTIIDSLLLELWQTEELNRARLISLASQLILIETR